MDQIREEDRKDLLEGDLDWINAGREREWVGLWFWRDEIEDPLK